ncbi:photosynthetic complex putative assembly protein PuhB [Falsiroseomonas sp. CW058]|uniref:photosynthetic complex putative assembly protein PuhB n=1 Tax=Falsiroseomonas sp. CW058 TaxID=3388664 RepID=UPI003D311512
MRATFNEHEREPIPGIPGALPDGEALLWQGRPGWRGIATRAMHLRAIAVYFAVLALWRGAALTAEGAGFAEAALGAGLLVAIGAVPLALLAGIAWFYGRSTIYSITSRRLVIQTGIALPMTVGIPFAAIASAALARHADGSGDIAVKLLPRHRVSWLALWPHVRPWRVARAEPTLRALPEAEAVAQVLSRALAASASMPVQAVPAAGGAHAPSRPTAEAMA